MLVDSERVLITVFIWCIMILQYCTGHVARSFSITSLGVGDREMIILYGWGSALYVPFSAVTLFIWSLVYCKSVKSCTKLLKVLLQRSNSVMNYLLKTEIIQRGVAKWGYKKSAFVVDLLQVPECDKVNSDDQGSVSLPPGWQRHEGVKLCHSLQLMQHVCATWLIASRQHFIYNWSFLPQMNIKHWSNAKPNATLLTRNLSPVVSKGRKIFIMLCVTPFIVNKNGCSLCFVRLSSWHLQWPASSGKKAERLFKFGAWDPLYVEGILCHICNQPTRACCLLRTHGQPTVTGVLL